MKFRIFMELVDTICIIWLNLPNDGSNMPEKRSAVRPQHLEGMKALGKQIIACKLYVFEGV